MNRLFLTSVAVCTFISGCSTHKPVDNMVSDQKIAAQYREVILEKSSGEKPDWVINSESSFEKDGALYFVSEGEDGEGYALAQRIAKAGAAQELAEQVSIKIKSELTKSAQRHGVAMNGSFVQDAVALTSQAVTLQDFTVEKSYKEKFVTPRDGRVHYKVYALYRIPLTEYQNAKARALAKLLGQAAKIQDVQAEQTAKILLADLKSAQD